MNRGVSVAGIAAREGLRGISQTVDGLLLGDVIVGIDAATIEDYDDLYNAIDAHKAGDQVAVKVRRNDAALSMRATVIELQR